VTDANCFICLAEDSGSVTPGNQVEVQPFLGLI
jgi:hypothetical protein